MPATMISMFSKHRLEALSDGIFAIVMTLLILDIKVPVDTPPGELWHAIAHEGHTWISLAVTFIIAARYWTLQHKLFDLIERTMPRTVFTTFCFLGLVTALPFSTSLWGHHLNEPIAFFLYFLNQALVGAVILLELAMAHRDGNLRPGPAAVKLRNRTIVMTVAMCSATVSAWLLPTRYIGLVAAFAAVVGRRIMARMEKPPSDGHFVQ